MHNVVLIFLALSGNTTATLDRGYETVYECNIDKDQMVAEFEDAWEIDDKSILAGCIEN